MELEEAERFLENQKWVFAKTYANKAPHEYCLLKRVVGNPEDFQKVAKYIKEEGIYGFFYNQERNYLFLGGKMYWIMDQSRKHLCFCEGS